MIQTENQHLYAAPPASSWIMPPVLSRNNNMDAPSLPPGRTAAQCQHPGCSAYFQGDGHYCPKHFLNQSSNSAAKKASGLPLPANSRLGTEFNERSGKTARKGTKGSAPASRPASQQSAAHPNPSLLSSRPSLPPARPQEPAHNTRGSVSSSSPRQKTTPTLPPPRIGTRRNGSSPLKIAHLPPSDSEDKAFSDDEVAEVEADAWYERATPSDKDREGSLDMPYQYDPRLLVPKLVARDLLSKQQEPVHSLLPSPLGMPLHKHMSEKSASHHAGPSSMPTPSSGSFTGSPGGAASRKRPRSPEPLAPTRRFTTRQPVSPYVHAGYFSREDHSEVDLVPESPVESDSLNDTNDNIEVPPPDTAPSKKKGRLTGEELRLKLAQDFDQAKFDCVFYGQEEAGSPPKGVVPTKRGPPRPPGVGDGRLYLRIDPRIHWPRVWSDEWYEEKMKEIKARGNRRANFGKAAKRMREQRLKEMALAAEEQEAKAAGEPLRRREPRPWGHQRRIDFGDVPEENLPWRVKANPAWLKACAWMRANRVKEKQRDQEVETLKAIGRSFRHLRGKTGW